MGARIEVVKAEGPAGDGDYRHDSLRIEAGAEAEPRTMRDDDSIRRYIETQVSLTPK